MANFQDLNGVHRATSGQNTEVNLVDLIREVIDSPKTLLTIAKGFFMGLVRDENEYLGAFLDGSKVGDVHLIMTGRIPRIELLKKRSFKDLMHRAQEGYTLTIAKSEQEAYGIFYISKEGQLTVEKLDPPEEFKARGVFDPVLFLQEYVERSASTYDQEIPNN